MRRFYIEFSRLYHSVSGRACGGAEPLLSTSSRPAAVSLGRLEALVGQAARTPGTAHFLLKGNLPREHRKICGWCYRRK